MTALGAISRRLRPAAGVLAAGIAVGAAAAAPAAEAVKTDAVPAPLEGAMERANEARRERGAEPLVRSSALDRAAAAKAAVLASEAELFPSARPEQLSALARLEDLPEHLGAAGFVPRRAKAHVLVADRAVTVDDLVDREPALRSDLLDPGLRELGIGRARAGAVEIVVTIVALSKQLDFILRTGGLEDVEAVRRALLERTNLARGENGSPPLRVDPCLERTAQRYAERMLGEGFYGHLSPQGEDVARRARAERCESRRLAENLARGQTSAGEVIEGWLDSPGHRRNLLGVDYRRVGFGMALGRQADEYWIVWVQVLGGR